MDMNKEWMMAPRLSNEYLKGVEDFLEFLRANRQKLGGDDWYCCPCVKCRNIVGGKKTLRDIREHLICDGIDTSYTRWIHHGEIQSTSTVNIGTINNSEDAFPRMVDMVNDVFARIPNEDGVEHHMGGSAPTGMDETNHEEDVNAQDSSPEGIQYKKLMEDAMQPLYPSCTTGRKGQARVAAELKAKNPDQPLTRTDLFLATHKRKDGSASSPHVDDVITACESNSSVAQGDLDHDAVTNVFGRDSRGRVRGLGTISKTAIKHSAPYKRALEEEHECNTHLQTEVKRLKEGQMGIQREMEELKQALTQGGTQVRPSTYYGSSSQAQDDSSCQLACTNQPNINTRQGPCRLLHYVRKEITVALGRVLGLSIEEEGCYRIVVDEILKSDVELLGGEKTFGDLTMGDIISWPTYRTVFG